MQAPSIIESNRQKNWFTMDSAPYQPDQATKNILVVVQQLLNSSHDSTEFVHKILQSYESITNDRIMGEAYCLHCKGRSEPYCKNGDRLLHVFLRAKDHQGTHHPILLKEHLVFYKTFKCLKEEMRKNFGDALNEKNADGKTYGDLQFHFKDRVISSVEVSPLRMCKLIDDLIIDEHLNVLTDAQKRKKFHHFRHFLRYRAQTAYSENEHVVCEKGDTFLALAMQRHAFINSSDADAQKKYKTLIKFLIDLAADPKNYNKGGSNFLNESKPKLHSSDDSELFMEWIEASQFKKPFPVLRKRTKKQIQSREVKKPKTKSDTDLSKKPIEKNG